jgi:anaerobic selenocysteine-containing dehydrogenase
VTRLDPDPDHPNGGVICIKGRAAPDLVYHPDRLDHPLRRTRPKGDPDPGWQRVSWDEALDAVGEQLLRIRDRYGSRSVALIKGTPSGTSVQDAERWLARFLNAFGSPNWAGTTHVCNWHKDTGFSYTFGANLPTPDLARSGAFLLWGHNPSSTSLILAHDIVAARTRGMKIVAVDPRRVGISGQADVLLQMRPGSDGALALALVHALIESGDYDSDFVRKWTNGPFLIRGDTGCVLTEADLIAEGNTDRYVVWDEVSDRPAIYDPASRSFEKDGVRPGFFGERIVQDRTGTKVACQPVFAALASLAERYAPERSESVTWVARENVRQAAHLLAAHRPVSMFMWNGVGQHTNASQTSRAIAVLYALLGDIDQPGGNVIFPKAPVNAVDGKEFLSKEMITERLGLKEKPLGPPAKPGTCAAGDIYTAILDGRPYPVKAVLNFGSNTVMSNADSARARQAFVALEFAVATEQFMTPTAELCDYVLPATSFLEMANLTTGFDHRPEAKAHLQYRAAVVPPLGERRSDTSIVFELAKRLGFGHQFWGGDIEAGYAHELAPTGMGVEKLKEFPGGITAPVSLRYRKHAVINEKGVPRGFNTPSGKVELYSHTFAAHAFPALPEFVEPAISPVSCPDLAAEYPLVLTNAKSTTFIHSQHRALSRLRESSPEPTAEMHPDTAARYGIRPGEWMFVESPRGSIRVRARVTERIIAGVVCCQHGWWQACNELNLPGYNPYTAEGANPATLIGLDLTDPISGSLPHRSYLCRVRPAEK